MYINELMENLAILIKSLLKNQERDFVRKERKLRVEDIYRLNIPKINTFLVYSFTFSYCNVRPALNPANTVIPTSAKTTPWRSMLKIRRVFQSR